MRRVAQSRTRIYVANQAFGGRSYEDLPELRHTVAYAPGVVHAGLSEWRGGGEREGDGRREEGGGKGIMGQGCREPGVCGRPRRCWPSPRPLCLCTVVALSFVFRPLLRFDPTPRLAAKPTRLLPITPS